MDGHTVGPTNPKLGTEDHLCPGKVYSGWKSGFEAAVEAVNVFQLGAQRWHGNFAARGRAERCLGINNLRT